MDHSQAVALGAVEKYLLNELTGPQRAQFEEHYFGCPQCAAELRMTADFLALAKQELKRGPFPKESRAPRRAWLQWLLQPAVLTPAFGLLIAIVGYQNVVQLPQLAGQMAKLKQPGVVSMVSLIGSNSRGGELPTLSGPSGQPVVLSLDIPATQPYSAYACVLLDASGAPVWRVPVSPAQAQDTVSISVPAGTLRAGNYTLVVQGLEGRDGSEPGAREATDLVRYRFVLNPGS